jgi:phosphomannomutase
LQKSPILLDMANGAYSSLACNFFTRLGIPFIEVACTPGDKKINTGCGVGVLEELESEVTFSKDLPQTLLSLFAAGRKAETKKAYAIVLDGDGDRAFVLAYQGKTDSVRIYDGDDLGYMLASSQNATYQGKEKPLFVSTIESDANLALSVAKNLQWRTKTTCVGDRWLIEDEDQIGQPFLGCERSGHLILPLLVALQKKKGKTGILCTGNGLLTALLSLKAFMENELNAIVFAHGFRSSLSRRSGHLQGFYRNAPVWNTFFTALQESFPWVCTEQRFNQEPDMIFFGFTRADSTGVGHCYMRKSGTEPKISICVSVGEEDKACAKEGLETLFLMLEKEF